MQHDYDLLIAGGGLAGNCLALALKETGLRMAIIEASTRKQLQASPAAGRALALAAGTVKMLEALGIWKGLSQAATAIKNIHISDRGHFGKTRLSAQNENVPALGYVVIARDIEEHVANLVNAANIPVICPARVAGLMSGDEEICISLKQGNESLGVAAKLLVGADGGNSSVRSLLDIPQQKTDYGQTAMITLVKSSLPNNNTAYERFTPSGPLALLPVGYDHCAVVWTRTNEDAGGLISGGEADFLAELQQCFGYKLGELSMAAPRCAFPVSLIRAMKMVSGRAVIVGNAVHQLHPVAGQGFNLGLRDVAQLAEMLIKKHEEDKDIGAAEFLRAYAESRQKDHDRVIGFTDALVRIFSNDWLALAAARNIGLAIFDQVAVAKSLLARNAMGLAGPMPRLGGRK
ncbi:2-polyprenyl-6-methoxyphenol 4-hydroxylase [Candidatus Methylobacter favarea]|uniref:2-polyprenyl-6-methoxyphenol 4-hydroxylase n=1 Tax=Candidatus Methylobacter favarea TaxID=2707345 RepID=A0A8S0XQK8_9GAMM|nr:2-octaprenyl-6-methoxyphenyl hydroxylase [Candidatus Methylobacter favarea]CAA9889397.1 2-polyprenyl-6-methoxyphenol 4-hydroxylase [Candidatus Methylobacter favarea]